MKTILNLIISARPKQWIKNMFIFMPLVFGGKLINGNDILISIKAFIIFSICASGIYIINDVFDIENDKFHSKKKKRPISAGLIKPKTAIIFASLLFLTALLTSYALNKGFFSAICFYTIIHLLYSFRLKRAVILDVALIALGFEMRVWAGALVVGILPSIWLQLCVFILAMFLGLIKRRSEKITLYKKAAEHRNVLSHYKVYFLDQLILMAGTLSIVFYGLYCVSPQITSRFGSNAMAYTIPFVIYGIFRYLYVVHSGNKGDDPGEILTTDLPLLIDILLWTFVSSILVYARPF